MKKIEVTEEMINTAIDNLVEVVNISLRAAKGEPKPDDDKRAEEIKEWLEQYKDLIDEYEDEIRNRSQKS